MSKTRLTFFASLMALALAPSTSDAGGAWVLDSQYSFPSPDGVQIVAPFVAGAEAGRGDVWVLGNHGDSGTCLLIGPFTEDDPPTTTWALPEMDGEVPPTQCLWVESGPDEGFLIRGFIPPPPETFDPPLGFIVLLDADFEIVWGPTFGEDHVEIGDYGEPLAPVAWSDRRDRVMTFFMGAIDIGPDTSGHLHGLSIADGTGLVRRVVTDWGSASSGTLQGLLVEPEAGKFLVVAHDNGTQFLVYDGLESMDQLVPGDIDWSDQSVDYVQYGDDDSLYVVHHPRLDMDGVPGSLSRFSSDGEIEFYTRDLSRSVELLDPITEVDVEVALPRPILSYATTSTATFVRIAGGLVFLHVYDNFNGREMAVQPLSSVDENVPTHIADARSPDRLVLMTGVQNPDFSVTRFVDIIAWDGDAETPGGIPVVDDPPDEADVGNLVDVGGDGGDGGNGGGSETPTPDVGCCQTARSHPAPKAPLLALALGCVTLWRARRRV